MSINPNKQNEIKTDSINMTRDRIITLTQQTPDVNTQVDNPNESKEVKKEEITTKSNRVKNLILQANQNKYYTLLNRLINSNKWILFNLLLILISASISIYAIFTFFYPSLSKNYSLI